MRTTATERQQRSLDCSAARTLTVQNKLDGIHSKSMYAAADQNEPHHDNAEARVNSGLSQLRQRRQERICLRGHADRHADEAAERRLGIVAHLRHPSDHTWALPQWRT